MPNADWDINVKESHAEHCLSIRVDQPKSISSPTELIEITLPTSGTYENHSTQIGTFHNEEHYKGYVLTPGDISAKNVKYPVEDKVSFTQKMFVQTTLGGSGVLLMHGYKIRPESSCNLRILLPKLSWARRCYGNILKWLYGLYHKSPIHIHDGYNVDYFNFIPSLSSEKGRPIFAYHTLPNVAFGFLFSPTRFGDIFSAVIGVVIKPFLG